ncbi:TMEM165/GDT1 family protein [Spirulina sp. 06S082]|uniref:TMEM165/GDT1 family protein n=1 Tax=Spirulina sp. 06S082 TaxID=3110248 RepID=UPI002B1FBD61|nr:TMEM165/GDT1 family protein [Spirulina sp. 06S082]MEA5472255.1 TMEM165/GDT1 family protein [Spirulina sp. 06S082]
MTAIKPTSEARSQLPNLSETGDRHNLQKSSWRSSAFWGTFSTTFVTICLAEMGDKTQLATLLIVAESQSPWVVFAGAAIALITTSLIGVLLGWWLSKRISPKAMDLAAAAILLFVAILLLWDVVQV